MGDVEILHRLYTNAAGGGPFPMPGAHAVPLEEHDAAGAVSPEILTALDELLRQTTPAGHQTAYVVCRFAGEETYGCVLVSYPDVFVDANGRPGFLNHARLVRVTEPSFDAAALHEVVLTSPNIYEVRADERLKTYVDSIEASVLVRPVTISELQQLPQPLLTEFLTACLVVLAGRTGVRFRLSDTDPATLARAWAALPMALQRRSSWAVGVESCAVDAIFTRSEGQTPAGAATRSLIECVDGYVTLLHEAPQEAMAILRNPGVSTTVAFAEAVRRARVSAPLSEVPISGKGEMSNKNRGRDPKPETRSDREQWAPVDDETVAQMKRQHEALEASLRIYIDERLAAIENRLRVSAPPMPASGNPAGRLRRAWILPAFLVALAVVAYGAFVLFPRSQPVRQPDRIEETRRAVPPVVETDQPAVDPPVTTVQRAVAAAEASGKWAEELKAFLETDTNTTVRAIDGAASGATGKAKADLTAFADRIAQGKQLGSEGPQGREGLRALLMDCIAAEVVPEAAVKIDGNLDDVTAHLAAVKKRYTVTSTLKDATQRELQSEIILRWMAER